MLFSEKDPLHVAALVNAVVDDASLRDRIIAGQDAALDRLARRDFGGTLLGFVGRMLDTPRRPHPPVAFDFWDQTRYADELEEIKAYRPSAFLALPNDPGDGRRETGDVSPAAAADSRLPTPDSRP